MSLNININKKNYEATAGETILTVLKRNGIIVPTLCHIKESLPTGACRMCVVEDAKSGKMLTACSEPVVDGMAIMTHSHQVVEARKVLVELLLSNHPDDCLYCVRNGKCDLQDLAIVHNVRERRISGAKSETKLDLSNPGIERDPAKCILCGRCVSVCEDVMGVSAIDFLYRGSKSVIGTNFDKGLNLSDCINCGQCIMVCPTGALREKSHIPEITSALRNKSKTVVVQYAPAVTVSLAEDFGMESNRDAAGVLNAALRQIGFEMVFDTSFSADLTVMEESAELIKRIQNNENLPLITSCCPAWVKYAEQKAPDFLSNLSTCKSPQQMMGAVVNKYLAESIGIESRDIYSVAIMPCTAKKFEGQREEMTRQGISDVDAVLTTRELIQMIQMHGIDLNAIEPEVTDHPFGLRSSAGKLFGVSGGVMEAAVRTAYFKITGKELHQYKINDVRGYKSRKETRVNIDGLEIGVAVVNGMAEAKLLLDEIRDGRSDLHFIEIMACPGGCIGGGGQPITKDEMAWEKKSKSIYNIDASEGIKVAHKNPEVMELYAKHLGEPLGEASHHLLHTSYSEREN